MRIDSEILEELSGGGSDPDWLTIKDELYDTTRWGNTYRLIVQEKATGKLYKHIYEIGSGDSDYSSWDDCGEYVDIEQVIEVEKTVIDYVAY